MVGLAGFGEWGSRSRSDGFTLIELVVVLAVISLVLALVLPSFRQPTGSPAIAAAAHDIAAALRLTRSRAIVEDRLTSFVWRDGGFSAIDSAATPVQHVPAGIALTMLGAESARGGRSIRFYPDGSSTGGGIALTAGAARYVVLVNWLNGDVSIRPQAAQTPR